MLMMMLFLLAGFILGVVLTFLVGSMIVRVLLDDARRIVDTHLAGIPLPFAAPAVTPHRVGRE